MGTKTRTQMITDIRADLDDAGSVWSAGELNRAIEHAVWDLSRFMPRQLYKEYTLDLAQVSAESWNSAAAAGTYVSLANKPIKFGSETVTDSSGNACTRDTDYTMDYINGKITHISGGEIDNSETGCAITYTSSLIQIDVSDLTNLIRIRDVEYRVGDVPQNSVGWNLFGGILTVTDQGPQTSQGNLSDGQHIVIAYEAYHTAPSDSAAGTMEIFIEEVVIQLAEAYALLNKAVTFYFQSDTDCGTARTTLGYAGDLTSGLYKDVDDALDAIVTAVAASGDVDTALDAAATSFAAATTALGKVDTNPDTNLTDAVAALDALVTSLEASGDFDTAADKIATYLEDNTNEDAKYWLTKITTDIASLRTAFTTAVDACNTALDLIPGSGSGDLYNAEQVFADEEMHMRENITEGVTTSASTNQLVDTSATFSAADLGKLVHNRTDDTWAVVVEVVSSTTLEISHDIMANAEDYAIMFPQAAALIGFGIKDINKITVGKDVPERFLATVNASLGIAASYAQRRSDYINIGATRANVALAYLQEASTRLTNLQTYITQATGWMSVAGGFRDEAELRLSAAETRLREASGRLEIAMVWISEAAQRVQVGMGYIAEAEQRIVIPRLRLAEAETRLAMIDRFIQESGQYQQLSYMDLQLADRFRTEGQAKRDECWAILGDPKQYLGQFSFSSTYQIPGISATSSGVRVK